MNVFFGAIGYTDIFSGSFETLEMVLPDFGAVAFAERRIVNDGVDS